MDTPRAIVEHTYDAWARNDFVEWLCTFHPDVRWHQEDGLPYPGDRIGRGALGALVRDVLSDWRRLEVTPRRWTVHGDVVVVSGSYAAVGQTTGFRFIDRFTHVWVVEGELIVEIRSYRNSANAMRDLDRRVDLATA